jgi:ComF family protein
MQHLGQLALARLFPPTCVLCGAPGLPGVDLCTGCMNDLPRNRPCCPRCAIPMPPDQPPGWVCGECRRHPPPFALAHTAFVYREPVTVMVAGAKFRGRLNLARLLGICLAGSLLDSHVELPDLVVPVPLHPARMRERGYNQALEIARAAAPRLGVRIDAARCVRTRSVTPQEGLERAQRRRNVRGAFEVGGRLDAAHVAILDDVVTTGSTAAEMAKALRGAGVDRVDLWAVARTP